MIETTNTIQCKSLWDEKRQHRYLFQKIWDDKKDKLLVISKSAGIDDGVEQTVTQIIITNNLNELGFGGFALCNLISDLSGKSKKMSDENIKLLSEQIKSKDFAGIIICWGSQEKFPDYLKSEAEKVLELIKKSKGETVYRITDGTTMGFCHPLSPRVRNNFQLAQVKL